MKAYARIVLFASAAATVAGCAGAAANGGTPATPTRRPTIELLARAISYDSAGVTKSAGNAPVDVTLSLVGERLLDYASQEMADFSTAGTVAALAAFEPPSRHTCCWQPSSLSLPSSRPAPASRVVIPAAIDEEAPSEFDADRGAAMQAVGVSLPNLEHVKLPASELFELARLGVDVGSPAVAIVDVGDPAAPVVLDLRPPDARELASDPSNPPTTVDLPQTLEPATGRCADLTTPIPERFARTMSALGPAFFHKRLATPRDVPRGTVSMSWAVLGPTHVRALFASVARGCSQRVMVDIVPASQLKLPRGLRRKPARVGKLYGETDGLRSVFVYDKIAYDVKGATAFATRTFARGLLADPAASQNGTTE